MKFQNRILVLLISLLPCLPAHAASGIAGLQQFYARVQSLETRFEQQQLDEDGRTLQTAAGVFTLARPDRFRWEYSSPYRQSMVSDGRSFWFYDVDLAQVTRRPVADALAGTPALLLSGGPALREQFRLEDQGSREGLDWVLLTPRATEGDFREIRLGLSGGEPRRMELQDNLGQLTRIRFSQLRVNPALPAAHFSFTPPAGVELVEETAPAPVGKAAR